MVDKNIDEQTTKILTICFVCLLCSLVDDENHEDLMSRSIKNNIGHTSEIMLNCYFAGDHALVDLACIGHFNPKAITVIKAMFRES